MALYNNGYPATYQNPYLYQYQQPAQQSQQNAGIIWVQGEAGAKSYLVAPNTTVQLWDSESQTIYLKSADGSGMPSMKVLDYTIRDTASVKAANAPAAAIVDASRYIAREEFDAVIEQINGLKTKVDKLSRKKVEDDE